MPRFGAPAPPQNVRRAKATGLSSTRSEAIADDETDTLRHLEETTPHDGFTGIFSRSRFRPPAPMLRAGHGSREGPVRPTYGDEFDPAHDLTQFPYETAEVDDEDDLDDLRRGRGALGTDDVELARRGILRYVRRRVQVPVAGTRLVDPIRWGDPPVPRTLRQLRYTLRREFRQNAQTFDFDHTRVRRESHYSTSPVRMGPPRSNRLTYRDQPGSFGQTTEVLTDA